MRLLIVILIFFLPSVALQGQESVEGRVKDSVSGEPLPYCNIFLTSSHKGTLTNTDGFFIIRGPDRGDAVRISFVGYETRNISIGGLKKHPLVLLKRDDIRLEELTVHSTNEYLYKILEACRKKLLKDTSGHVGKVYCGVGTETSEQPLELLECYYNGSFKGCKIDQLSLKNGRTALAVLDDRLMLTLNTSKLLTYIDPARENAYMPSMPLQFVKRVMKKKFRLKLLSNTGAAWRIRYEPVTDTGMYFSGEIVIDKDFDLVQTTMKIRNATLHPFKPWVSLDTLSDICLAISTNYRKEENMVFLDHISFTYQADYKSVRDTLKHSHSPVITREITTKGILFCYDYGNPFVLPFFRYDENLNDYDKMSIIPYNRSFWQKNNTLLLTDRQKDDLGFFIRKGQLINFGDSNNYGRHLLDRYRPEFNYMYEYYYCFWSPHERIALNRKLNQNNTYSLDMANRMVQSDLVKLAVQILLDVNEINDSNYCSSYSIFDISKTCYHLPKDSLTNVILNIYFDIYEIGRREMQQKLGSANKLTLPQIRAVYSETLNQAEKTASQFLRDVQYGKKAQKLWKWNEYVNQHLGIDNLKLFIPARFEGTEKETAGPENME